MKKYFRPSVIATLLCFVYMMVLAIVSQNPLIWFTLSERRAPDELKPYAYSEEGYDGESVYLIARYPASADQYIDRAPYRYQRILLPALARLLALGQVDFLPPVLLLLNLAALFAGTWALEKLLQQYQVSVWYASGYAFSVGIFGAARLSMTEPLAYGLVLFGILAAQRNRWLWSAVIFALAALAKETTLFFPAAYGFYLLYRRDWLNAIRFGVIVLLPILLWQGYIFTRFGEIGISSGGATASGFEILPFAGYWRVLLIGGLAPFLLISAINFPFVILPTLWGIVVCIRDFVQRKWTIETQVLFFNIAIMPFVPLSTYGEFLGILRFIVGIQIAVIWYSASRGLKRPLLYSTLWFVPTLMVIGSDRLTLAG